MGCCENREKEPQEESKSKKKTMKTLSFSQMKDQDLVVVPDRSPLSKQLEVHKSSESLRLYIEWCRSMRKWSEIVEFVGDFTQLEETFQFVQGVTPPQTISSLVVVYLYLELQKEQTTVMGVVEKTIFDVFRLLNKSSEDFIENSLVLTRLYLKNANKEAVEKLIRFGMFEVLHNILKDRAEKIGKITLQVFFNAVSRRVEGKQAFWLYGLEDLFEIVEKNRKKSQKVTQLVVEILEEMTTGLAKDTKKQIKQKVRDSKVFQQLKSVNTQDFSLESQEMIQNLIKKIE